MGGTKDIEASLSLVTEQVQKVSLSSSLKKHLRTMFKKIDNGEDIVPLIMKLEDLSTDFQTNHAPVDLTDVELANPVKVKCGSFVLNVIWIESGN